MAILAPSILSADFSELGKEVKKISDLGCEYIHIDVMDGAFVPNISFGPPIIKAIRPYSNKIFDVHLMVEEPIRYLSDFIDAGADSITVHYEACKHLHRDITEIKKAGIRVGISINPSTSVVLLEPIIKDIDLVLIMSVNPGFGGQSFIPYSIEKVKQVKEMIKRTDSTCCIQIDGGVNLNNAKEIVEAGADILVAGSSVFMADHIEDTIKAFNEIIGG